MTRRGDSKLTLSFERLFTELRTGPAPQGGEWLARLVDLLRPSQRRPAATAVPNFRELVWFLQRHRSYAVALNAHLGPLLAARMHRIVYADAGVLANESFLGGLYRCLLGKLLPPAVDTGYLRDLITEVFERPRDYAWLCAIPLSEWNALFDAVEFDGEAFASARAQCRHEALEALRLCAVRLAALGTEPTLLQYLPALARHESPFLAQAAEAQAFIAGARANDAGSPDDRHLSVLLDQCVEYVETIRRRSHTAGVGVALVFLLARIEQLIERMHELAGLLVGARAAEAADAGRGERIVGFLLRLVRQENRRNSVRDLFSSVTELTARRITEQASLSGEHYITETRAEFVEMYRAAAGAGFIIAALALLKLLVAQGHLPLLWEGVAFSLVYGLGFVLIHVLHLTIATKQPAMTAATLAAALDGREDRESRLDALAELAAQVCRTQWLSIAGNVSVTMLTAFAIALLAGQFAGWFPADASKAAGLLHDLHPWRSLALLHAAIAGVYLFLSGLISGYYDNLALYHRIPQRIRRIRWLRRLLGAARLEDLSHYVEHNLGALAGNFLFGCMLGFTPIVGELVGLPLDIRHVAFASANFAYGLVGLQFEVGLAGVAICAAGVLLIGLVNLAVSFSLALRVALRSRGITREQTAGLWPRVLRRFLARPRDFFWPPAFDGAAP